jgi:hypothetical protein
VTWIEEQNPEPDVPITITIKPLGTVRVIFSGDVEIESEEAIERFRQIQKKAIERINRRFERLVMFDPMAVSVYQYRTGRRL